MFWQLTNPSGCLPSAYLLPASPSLHIVAPFWPALLATANYRQHISSYLALTHLPSLSLTLSLPLAASLSVLQPVKIACLGIGHYRGKASISDGQHGQQRATLGNTIANCTWAIAWPITVPGQAKQGKWSSACNSILPKKKKTSLTRAQQQKEIYREPCLQTHKSPSSTDQFASIPFPPVEISCSV